MSLDGNRLTLMRSGAEYFPALLAALSSAKREIFLESYLYEPDEIGRQVAARLIRAARRGVATHLLLDGFGARLLPAWLQDSLRRGGVRLLFFRPEQGWLKFDTQRLRRMHRKLVVIDGLFGFIGGINILADTTQAGNLAPRYDYAMRVAGPLAAEMRLLAASQWQRTAWMQLKPDLGHTPAAPHYPPHVGHHTAHLVRRDNIAHRRDIERAYYHAIAAAKREIVLANAYFLPGRTLRRALLRARKRGVRVVILVQGRLDHPLLFYATRVLYGPMLDAGVEIHEYTAGFMHAKVGVIDREWLTVGSSNIDPFSLLTARELNLIAVDPELANELREDIQQHIEHDAVAVLPALHHHAFWRNALSWLAYQAVRLMLGLSGYGGHEYRE